MLRSNVYSTLFLYNCIILYIIQYCIILYIIQLQEQATRKKSIIFFHRVRHFIDRFSYIFILYEIVFVRNRHVVSLETVVKRRGGRLLLCLTNGVSRQCSVVRGNIRMKSQQKGWTVDHHWIFLMFCGSRICLY